MTSRNLLRTGAVAAAVALALSACGGGGPASDAAANVAGDADKLGGQAAVDTMTGLYEAAKAAGKTEVVVYGPGENDKADVYKAFQKRFPAIRVTGEYLVGPQLASKINQEFGSGKHVADLVQGGDTTVAAQLDERRYAKFAPVTAATLGKEYQDPGGTVFAASGSIMGILYNVDRVPAPDAPKGWRDLLDPRWKGRMVLDDATKNGAVAGTFSRMLHDGRYDDTYLSGLAGQEIHWVASGPVAGNAVATGEFEVAPVYPYSFYLRDKAKHAPVKLVFPVDGGNQVSPHYLGLVDGAPHPDAAKLLMTWLFTPEGQQAVADAGYAPTMPNAPNVAGLPPLSTMDQLKPFAIAEVNAAQAAYLAKSKQIFGRG
ncbi:ABC transporter substrate-binding protein [Plantactinospora endophytica]|uniref:ABC transporter substrate-binding protein n=1 Tax=Plantactinospora endophytica TaxID=673535 RepID=A0ABQ4E3L2_9ACTN|nr:extracellular solute-binding protein [Plantactinospora endophytica]GIG89303.1 hypothetical protein Pen02_42390 [Plantactinospora endophytica]